MYDALSLQIKTPSLKAWVRKCFLVPEEEDMGGGGCWEGWSTQLRPQEMPRAPGQVLNSVLFLSVLPSPTGQGMMTFSLFDPLCFICENLEKSVTCLENKLPVCSIYCMHDWAVISLPLKRQNHNFLWFKCSLFFKRYRNVTHFRKTPA